MSHTLLCVFITTQLQFSLKISFPKLPLFFISFYFVLTLISTDQITKTPTCLSTTIWPSLSHHPSTFDFQAFITLSPLAFLTVTSKKLCKILNHFKSGIILQQSCKNYICNLLILTLCFKLLLLLVKFSLCQQRLLTLLQIVMSSVHRPSPFLLQFPSIVFFSSFPKNWTEMTFQTCQ